jgi:hypothetical protein
MCLRYLWAPLGRMHRPQWYPMNRPLSPDEVGSLKRLAVIVPLHKHLNVTRVILIFLYSFYNKWKEIKALHVP